MPQNSMKEIKEVKKPEFWTVILHYNRKSETTTDLLSEQAQALIKIAVFNNKDCVNFACFKQ